MQEKIDGSFGPIEDAEDLLKRLISNGKELQQTKCVHFGSPESLQEMRDKLKGAGVILVDNLEDITIEDRVTKLEKALEKIQEQNRKTLESDFIHMATKEQIDHVAMRRDFINKKCR